MADTNVFDNLGRGVKIAEKHREKRKHSGFIADLFGGNLSLGTFLPWPERSEADLEKERLVMEELGEFLRTRVDPEELDRTREIPLVLIEEMSKRGFFALKVPVELGGRGLSQSAYSNVVAMAASYSSAIVILISADNTIGAKYGILKYGTPEQKVRYLPELVKWPSGFCFTEELVGSDPARMRTFARRARNTSCEVIGYEINGQKWYTTNSIFAENVPLAKYLAVVAKIVDSPEEVERSDNFGLFVVATDAPGVVLGSRNEFCGMRGIYNANPRFDRVTVGKDQLIGSEGQGFRIALEALNTGRIAIAAGCLATAKQALRASRWYAMRREQWGKPIGKHEAIGSGMIAPGAADIFAMEAMTAYTAWLEDQKMDARLAAAALKVFASERSWTIVDNMMQIFGGRGYETYSSLSRREKTVPVERMFRDARPNRIFEGSTQILSQWFMREGCDEMLKQGSVFFENGKFGEKARLAIFFAARYAKLTVPRANVRACLVKGFGTHFVYIERTARKFARALIVYSGKYRGKFAQKQLTIERFFWIATELFAMTAALSYATRLSALGDGPAELADLYCRSARRRIEIMFGELGSNEDDLKRVVADGVLQGDYVFVEDGIVSTNESR